MTTSNAEPSSAPLDSARSRGGRPTRAAAAERDARLLDIATAMFMADGFDATSMDKLAETAAIGKATLYARYADKGALFTAVLRRRILQVYQPIENEFKAPLDGDDLEATLRRVAQRLLAKSLSSQSVALGRILSAHGPRFPELARLAVEEGIGRQLKLVESVLAQYSGQHIYALDDLPLAADVFLSMIQDRAARLAMYGVPVDPKRMEQRADIAVALFVRGLLQQPESSSSKP